MTNDAKLTALEERVGHPQQRWDELLDGVAVGTVRRFETIQSVWLELMWCLDAYRAASLAPREMGNPSLSDARRMAAVYRGKGNWFATLIAALLENRTNQRLAPRTDVQGFSQMHQIDVAWPDRRIDVLVAAETKVTGAPAYGDTPQRGSLSDFSNRRKELKFAATDLKLFRRQQDSRIEHWGVWRQNAEPKVYFLWAARLRQGRGDPNPRTGRRRDEEWVDRLIQEAQILVNTYLDGAGIFAWKPNDAGTGYESVPLPASAQVTALDDVLYRIESEINRVAAASGGEAPPPVTPEQRAVPTDVLPSDDLADGDSS